MGKPRETKLIILNVLLLVACFFVYNKTDSVQVEKKLRLKNFLTDLEGYKVARNISVDDHVYQFLDLDDYAFTTYTDHGNNINLFVGFYYTGSKVSAAHSPLSCFPGQGWAINQPSVYRLTFAEYVVDYAEITASLGETKELVLYWYQSNHDTTPYIYRNKINALYNKIVRNEEQHAFVRVSMPFAESDYDTTKQAGIDFIKAFYPKFIAYINENDNPAALQAKLNNGRI